MLIYHDEKKEFFYCSGFTLNLVSSFRRDIIKQLTGGLLVYLFMKWQLDIRHSLLISQFKSTRKLSPER